MDTASESPQEPPRGRPIVDDIGKKVRPKPIAVTAPSATGRFWRPSHEVEQRLAWLERGLLKEFGRIEEAVLKALAEVGSDFGDQDRQRYSQNSDKIRERGELWSMSNYLREYPLNYLAADAARVSPDIESEIKSLQVRAGRCSKAFSHFEMIQRILKFREQAIQKQDKAALLESDEHLKWRFFKLDALALNAHGDPAWGPIGRIIDGLRDSDARCFRELLRAVKAPLASPSNESVGTDPSPALRVNDYAFRVVVHDGFSPARGTALRFFREERGWSQRKMSEESKLRGVNGNGGIQRSVIQRAEEGHSMRRDNLLRFLDLLGVSEARMITYMDQRADAVSPN